MSITITNQQNLLNQSAGVGATGSTSEAANKATQLGQADFLQLLTVQLQNQDPMSPMSDMDFIASMSSFSSVDAISSLSTNFQSFMDDQSEMNLNMYETLAALSENLSSNKDLQAQLAAQAYLGKEVTINDAEKGEFTGTVDRIELIDKLNLDGSSEQVVGLVVNDEIFTLDSVSAIAEKDGIVSSFGNAVSSAIQIATGVI